MEKAMGSSKLTSKYQATIPKKVRKILKLRAGDFIIFRIAKDGSVTIKKVPKLDLECLKALNHTLIEWESKADDDAFKHLQDA
jgi:antitoxin PrlF